MKVYTNIRNLNNGFRALGQFPLDDRSVLGSLTAIFIDEAKPTDCPLYNLAYLGMSISVVEGDGTEENERVVSTIILKDATPYTPGKVVTVNSANYRNYWKVEGKDLEEYDNIPYHLIDIATVLSMICQPISMLIWILLLMR